MFTTMSSQVRKLTYVEVVDVVMHMEMGRMEKKASREAPKKLKVQGSFIGGSSSGQDIDSRGSRRLFKLGAMFIGPSSMNATTSSLDAKGAS